MYYRLSQCNTQIALDDALFISDPTCSSNDGIVKNLNIV